MPKAKPFSKGEKFGKLTALGESKSLNGGKSTYEKCLCECGNITWQNRNLIRRGRLISCGCARNNAARNNLIKANTRHSCAKTRIYSIYRGMKTRCNNKNSSHYSYYGGRGIKCLWNKFEDFYRDMGESYEVHVKKYGEKNTTIDRIYNNGDYCLDNCKRSTLSEQQNNKRRVKHLEYRGEVMNLSQICDKYNINYNTSRVRLSKGWSVKDIIETNWVNCGIWLMMSILGKNYI